VRKEKERGKREEFRLYLSHNFHSIIPTLFATMTRPTHLCKSRPCVPPEKRSHLALFTLSSSILSLTRLVVTQAVHERDRLTRLLILQLASQSSISSASLSFNFVLSTPTRLFSTLWSRRR